VGRLRARGKIPPAHFAYLATGVDDDATLRANREGFARIAIRVRRLVDVSRIDTSVTLLGTSWPTPIVLAPVGSQAAFHPDGETATAKAARAKRHLQILSTVSSTAIEDVNAARGEPVWYQLYPTEQWSVTQGLVARGRASIESLPEVVEGVKGRVPVLVDGGIRRGTDIFKALALGATAVAIGRPYIWGLGAFGQEGVETVLEILHRELITAMRHAGTPRVANVTRSYLADAPRR